MRVKNIQANLHNQNPTYQQAIKKYNELFRELQDKIRKIEIYDGFGYELSKSYQAVQELYNLKKQLETIYVKHIQTNQ